VSDLLGEAEVPKWSLGRGEIWWWGFDSCAWFVRGIICVLEGESFRGIEVVLVVGSLLCSFDLIEARSQIAYSNGIVVVNISTDVVLATRHCNSTQRADACARISRYPRLVQELVLY
jgi:hypothetical protein